MCEHHRRTRILQAGNHYVRWFVCSFGSLLMLLVGLTPAAAQHVDHDDVLHLHPYARYFSDSAIDEYRDMNLQKALQPLVVRIVRNNNRLQPLQAELLPLVINENSETILHTRLVTHQFQQIAIIVDNQAHLLGASLYIQEPYKRAFYQRRMADLQAASVRINALLDGLDTHYGRISVNAALHQIDLGRELVRPTLSMFEEAVLLLNEID